MLQISQTHLSGFLLHSKDPQTRPSTRHFDSLQDARQLAGEFRCAGGDISSIQVTSQDPDAMSNFEGLEPQECVKGNGGERLKAGVT